MEKIVTVAFPGGKKVDACIDGMVITSDQPLARGGENSSPSPFLGFLGSLANCAGYFALDFCQSRGIDTTGLSLVMKCSRDEEQKLFTNVSFELNLPQGFPEKYKSPIVRAMDLCAVKRHILNSPDFSISIVNE